MPATISDGDIETFLRRNAGEFPSQTSLIQAAVRLLWPKGAPTGGAEGSSGCAWVRGTSESR